jgi:2-oxoglutarate dehydrogenase complex dehydrogenase (E1) component-like enzyme
MKRDFRKPLVIAGPKGLLRNNKCISKFEDMGPGTKFERIWEYRNVDKISECETIILCSGKFVYDIDEILEKENKDRTALLTIEELFPFPESELKEILSKCKSSAKVYWVQE